MKLNKYGQQPFARLWAFMLSMVAHFGVVTIALGSGMWGDSTVAPSSYKRTAVVIAGLSDGAMQDGPSAIAIKQPVADSVEIRADAVDTIAQRKDEAANTQALPRPIDAAYSQATELTKLPSVKLDIPSDFSLPSANGVSRLAILRLLISQHGDVDQVLIEDASVSEQEQNLLKDAFSKTKFYAGEINGIAVKSQLRIEVTLNEVVNVK